VRRDGESEAHARGVSTTVTSTHFWCEGERHAALFDATVIGLPNRARAILAGCASASLMAGIVVAAAGGSGVESRQIGLGTGWAWFASRQIGAVSLIDGPTATRLAIVRNMGEPADDLEVSSAGADAWVVNRTRGDVVRVDGATFDPAARSTDALDGGDEFKLVANSAAVWEVVQGGRAVKEIDPRNGQSMGGLLATPGEVADAVVAPDGTLWVTLNDSEDVASFRGGQTRTRREVKGAAGARIVMVDDTPVVVPRGDDPPMTLSGSQGTLDKTMCLERDSTTQLYAGSDSGAGWLIALDPGAGIVTVADTRGPGCTPLPIGPGAAGRYGQPVEHRKKVFVPDIQAGTVIVLDPARPADPVVTRIELGLQQHQFHLFRQNGFVWFDDPASDIAGVITDDLKAKVVDKTQGDGTPRDPETNKGEDDKPDEQPPDPACNATPTTALAGQVITVDVVPNNPDISPDSWQWTSDDDADFDVATGPQAKVRFAIPGAHAVAATAPPINGVPPQCSVTIDVLQPDVPPPTTTSPPPQRSTIPPTTLEPPDVTQPATTLVETTAPTTATTVPTATTTTSPTPPTTTAPKKPPTTVPPTTVPPTPPPTAPPTPPPTTTAPPTTLAPPVSDFDWTPPNPVVGQAVTFTDRTPGTIGASQWTFEGAQITTATGPTAQATWSQPGTYRVTLVSMSDGVVGLATPKDVTVTPDNVVIPPTSGMNELQARNALESAGFVVTTVAIHRLTPVGVIVGTDPPATTSLPRGSAVTLNVSDGLGELSTIAGTGPGAAGYNGDEIPAAQATLNSPTQVILDAAGNIYIADNFDHRIRKITTDGIIHTIAGTGTPGFSGDGGPATAAEVKRPRAMALAPDGTLYFADLDNKRIRRIDTSGNISTVVTTTGSPAGVAYDADHNIVFYSDRGLCTVYAISAGGVAAVFGTGSCGSSPDGMAPNATSLNDAAGIAYFNGTLYVTEPHGHRIRKADLIGGTVATIVGTGTAGFNGDGADGPSTQLNNPDSIAVSGNRLVFTDWGNNRVRELLPDTTVNTIAGTGSGNYSGDGGAANAGTLNLSGTGESACVTIGPDGTIYIADPGNNAIRHII
jgi:sugar lactone lactonase YvrE